MKQDKNVNEEKTSYESRGQEESRIRLMNLFGKMQQWAQKAMSAKELKLKLENFLKEMKQAHPSFSVHDKQRDLDFTILLLVIVCVYGIDVLLFKATAEYHAGRVFSSEWVLTLASIIGPAMILLLEIGVGLQRHLSSINKDLNGSGGYFGWTIIGIGLASVMPMLAVATTYVALPELEGPVKTAFILQNVGLAILGLVSHILVLFSGRYGHDAKAYFPYRVSMFFGERKLKRAEKAYRQSINKTVALYEGYRAERDLHQFRYPNPPLQAMLLDYASLNILTEQFGVALARDTGQTVQVEATSNASEGGYHQHPQMETVLTNATASANETSSKGKIEKEEEARLQQIHSIDQQGEWPG